MDKKILQQYLFKEADIVQDIISRMSNYQFYIRGWSITLIVASLLIKGNLYHYFVAFIPWLIFWVYDCYFLRLEKLYRAYYKWLIINRLENEDSLLDVDRDRLENCLKADLKKQFRKEVPCTIQIMFCRSILPFYLFLFFIIVFMILVDYWTPESI